VIIIVVVELDFDHRRLPYLLPGIHAICKIPVEDLSVFAAYRLLTISSMRKTDSVLTVAGLSGIQNEIVYSVAELDRETQSSCHAQYNTYLSLSVDLSCDLQGMILLVDNNSKRSTPSTLYRLEPVRTVMRLPF
jgi:hypothetical protein